MGERARGEEVAADTGRVVTHSEPDAVDHSSVPTASRSFLLTPSAVLHLQRSSGNAAVAGVLRGGDLPPRPTPVVQREDEQVSVSGVRLSAGIVTVPLEPDLALTATAAPADATGVTYRVSAGSVGASAVNIDGTTGAITIGTQQGGTVEVTATSDDGASAMQELRIVEKPTSIASTESSSTDGVYGGEFTHTFTAPSGEASGLEGANVNERFDACTADTPFGTRPFRLHANPAGSHGWDLDASGKMLGPDNVTHAHRGINAGDFVRSASNPEPEHALPSGFTMTQHLHAKSLPSRSRDADAFADVSHTRTLQSAETVVVSAGTESISDAYAGPPVYYNAAASPDTVEASPPRAEDGSWERNTVQVDCDVSPSTATKTFRIVGRPLGCEVDDAGQVLIGTEPGTITVRIAAGRRGRNYDEATITITPRPPEGAAPEAPESGTATEEESESSAGLGAPLEPAP